MRYKYLLENQDKIPCARQITSVRDIDRLMMLDRVLSKRLEDKSFLVRSMLIKNNYDWEETTYQLLAKNFGFKINSEAFLRLSQSIPFKYLQKQKDNLHQIEAILFGQSGLLDLAEVKDKYIDLLKEEYKFLGHKYHLENKKLSSTQWKFMRLRPPNFPTIRIAQFAALIFKYSNLFSLFLEDDIQEIRKKLSIEQSDYWKTHYNFGKKSQKSIPGLGKSSIDNIFINTAVPLLACYAKEKNNEEYMDKALKILEDIPAENNRILSMWSEMGFKVKTAFDSQALIELNNNFCEKKKCLQCNIGISLIKKEGNS